MGRVGAAGQIRGGWLVTGMVMVLVVVTAGIVATIDGIGPIGSDEPDRWRYPLEVPGDGRFVAVGERVCSTTDTTLFCLDGNTGDELFTTQLSGPGVIAAHNDDTLVVAAGDDDLYGYSLDGEQQWAAEELGVDVDEFLYNGAELVMAGDVVAVTVGVTREELVGIDVHSGDERWQQLGEHLSWEVMSDGARFYGTTLSFDDPAGATPAVAAFDPSSGDELWRVSIGGPDDDGKYASEALGLGDGSVGLVVSGAPDEMLAVDVATGEEAWRVDAYTGNVAHSEGVTIVQEGLDVYGYDESGSEVWQRRLPDSGEFGNDTQGRFYVADDGTVYAYVSGVLAIDPSDGSVAATIRDLGPTDLAVVGDHVVVGHTDEILGISRPD